jgi:hypothetical protein
MEPEFRNEEEETYGGRPDIDRTATLAVQRGAAAETICGAVAVVLTIIGLAGAGTLGMMGVSALVIGAALLARGAGLATGSKDVEHGTRSRMRAAVLGGAGIDLIAGAVTVLLGILALAGVSTHAVLGVTCIVLGCTLLLSSGSLTELLRRQTGGTAGLRQAWRLAGTHGLDVLVGAATVVFGIVALSVRNVGTKDALILVSFLAVGGMLLLQGTSEGARFVPEARVHH